MGMRAHTYAVAYEDEEFDKMLYYSDYLTFNSLSQLEKYRDRLTDKVSIGLRINPEFSPVDIEL